MRQLITVILPVYNGEKYLSRAIDSVINQSFGIQNILLLAINDGGNDNSLNILNDYKLKYPEFITVIDQKNQGVANTRNQAIDRVETLYLTFLDQDDYFDKELLSTLYEAAELQSSDVVSSGYRRPDIDNQIRYSFQPKNMAYGKYIIMPAWSKLHRTEFLRKNRIQFLDNAFGEDYVFTVKEILLASNWTILEYSGYNWFYNQNSVSNTNQKKMDEINQASLYRLIAELLKLFPKKDKMGKYFMVQTSLYYLLYTGRFATPDFFIQTYYKIFNDLNEKYDDKLIDWTVVLGIPGQTIKMRFFISLFGILSKLHLNNISMRVFAKLYCKG